MKEETEESRGIPGELLECLLLIYYIEKMGANQKQGKRPAKIQKKIKKSIKKVLTKSEMFAIMESRKQAKPSESIKKEVGKVATK